MRKPFRSASSPAFAAVTLYVLSAICALATIVGTGLIVDAHLDQHGGMDPSFMVRLGMGIVGGLGFSGVLLGFASLIRYMQTLSAAAIDRHTGDEADDPLVQNSTLAASTNYRHALGSPSQNGHAVTHQIQSLLREIRDLTVVGNDERMAVHERIRSNLQRHAAEEIIEAVNRRELGRARSLLRDAEATYGSTATFERLSVKIEEAATRAESLDYARTKRIVEDAITAGAWAHAESLVKELAYNHPASAKSRVLWEDTRRARLLAHIHRCAAEHHWTEAVAATEEFLERFPDSVDSKALRSQLDTLRENAEIVQRRQIETRITELLGGHRYDEALRLAKHVVETFPDSPQAEALREQLPRLERRATA